MISGKYPTDRTIFFSDAVFAIAMTLLILELKIPTIDEVRQVGIDGILVKRIPNFIGFVVSFFVTALFWKAHLQICMYARSIDSRFLWLNIWLLFFVVLMPFTTAIYANYGFLNNLAFGFYCSNLAAIGFFTYFLQEHIIKTENLKATVESITIRWLKIRSLITPLVFLFCILIAFLAPMASRYGFILIFLFQFIGDKIYQRKKRQLPTNALPEE